MRLREAMIAAIRYNAQLARQDRSDVLRIEQGRTHRHAAFSQALFGFFKRDGE